MSTGRYRSLACLLFGLVLACSLGAADARAGDRYAIVIGSNQGEPDEPTLRFAERDAQRMAEVLMRLGGVRAEDLLTLLAPSRDALARALGAFKSRIGTRSEGDATVIIYYSGHADRSSLHLSGTRYSFSELKAAVRALAPELSVFLIDACRSGGIVRSKGLTPAEPFVFEIQDEVKAQGLAIITSSSESEDAQESDRLEGGVFTHHLLAGLLGAADASGDARVSLPEVYRYAYAQTLATTSESAIVQHPTYAFELQGQQELILTQLDMTNGRGRLRLDSGGQYLVLERFGARDLVAELEARDRTELSLPPGLYLVRRREAAAIFEREVTLLADRTTALGRADMARVPFRHAVRKGYGLAERRVLSLGADVELAGPLLPGTGILWLGAVSMQLDFAAIAFRARLRFGESGSENARVALSQRLLGLDVGINHLFDIGRHGLGFGLRAGLDWLAQRFDAVGEAPPNDQLVGRIGPFARAELALGGTVTLQLDAGFEVYLIEVDDAGRSVVEPRVLPTVALGLGFLLP